MINGVPVDVHPLALAPLVAIDGALPPDLVDGYLVQAGTLTGWVFFFSSVYSLEETSR